MQWFQLKDKDGNLVKPNVSHLRAYGSTCWVLSDDQDKLGVQGWKGKMVGYMGRRGYRIYDPKRQRVFNERNVIFEEGMPHRTRVHALDPPAPAAPPAVPPAAPALAAPPAVPPVAPHAPLPPPAVIAPPLPRRTAQSYLGF